MALGPTGRSAFRFFPFHDIMKVGCPPPLAAEAALISFLRALNSSSHGSRVLILRPLFSLPSPLTGKFPFLNFFPLSPLSTPSSNTLCRKDRLPDRTPVLLRLPRSNMKTYFQGFPSFFLVRSSSHKGPSQSCFPRACGPSF